VNVERIVTSGQFTLDGQSFDVDNNVWIVGDDDGIVIIDAAHDAQKIFTATQGRKVHGIICTHGHNDHINAAVVLQELVDAPISLHPADRMLWDVVHPEQAPDIELADGHVVRGLTVVHTPGHSPGGVCLAGGGVLFSGDTLFKGGPGATGRSFSDFPTIVESIRSKVLTLPDGTVVHTGHGDDTAVGDEAPHLQEWLDRGH
jgi:glyoxylase-like metal-dependent hydrolase (beta-lactamase superfamily II)